MDFVTLEGAMGRPRRCPGEDVTVFALKMTDRERLALDLAAAKANMSKADYIRSLLFKKRAVRGSQTLVRKAPVARFSSISEDSLPKVRKVARCDSPKGWFCYRCNEMH